MAWLSHSRQNLSTLSKVVLQIIQFSLLRAEKKNFSFWLNQCDIQRNHSWTECL